MERSLCSVTLQLEATSCDPLDQLYDALAEVLAAEEATEGYKNYFLVLPERDRVFFWNTVCL